MPYATELNGPVTLDDIKSAWIQEQSVRVNGDQVSEYRVNMKVSFVLKN
jgi:flavin-binding protein dodecin